MMLNDEKIEEIYAKEGLLGIKEFARAIYEQGRADQRESDAQLFSGPGSLYGSIAEAIRANTGDPAP